MKVFKGISFSTLLILTLFPLSLHAQELKWYETNSLRLDSLAQGVLFHADGQYSFFHSKGNMDGYIHQGMPRLFLRNGRLMFSANGNLKFQKIQVLSNPASRTRYIELNARAIYDLTKAFQLEAGTEWERDHSNFIDARAVHYTGLIYNAYHNPKFSKLFFAAVGYQFLESTALPAGLPVTHEDKPVLYFMQHASFSPIEYVKFSESFSFIEELNESKNYRTELTLSAQIPVTKHVVFVLTQQFKYEKEPIIPELGPYFEHANNSFTMGVRLNF